MEQVHHLQPGVRPLDAPHHYGELDDACAGLLGDEADGRVVGPLGRQDDLDALVLHAAHEVGHVLGGRGQARLGLEGPDALHAAGLQEIVEVAVVHDDPLAPELLAQLGPALLVLGQLHQEGPVARAIALLPRRVVGDEPLEDAVREVLAALGVEVEVGIALGVPVAGEVSIDHVGHLDGIPALRTRDESRATRLDERVVRLAEELRDVGVLERQADLEEDVGLARSDQLRGTQRHRVDVHRPPRQGGDLLDPLTADHRNQVGEVGDGRDHLQLGCGRQREGERCGRERDEEPDPHGPTTCCRGHACRRRR